MVQRFLALLAASMMCAVSLAQAGDANGVPSTLLNKLKTGVNVTRWFCYLAKPNDVKHYREYLTKDDMDTFKRLGLGFVRLCVSPECIYRDGKPDATNLAEIDAGIAKLNAAGLVVLWDLHDNGQLKLETNKHDVEFVSFWQSLASHYKGKLTNKLVFELVNEPTYNANGKDWYALQAKAVEAVRAIDPKRTIIVTPHAWSGIDALTTMEPLAQKNLIYTFHCYDPFQFTHQGASWVGDEPHLFKNVPFPSSPGAVEAIMPLNEARFAGSLKSYGEQRYDAAYLLSRLEKAAAFGTKNHVPVLLGEFGAYPPVSPPKSRARWFAGMRSAVDALHLPNAIWGYDDALGLGRSIEGGKFQLDPVTLKSFYGK